jgi:hypothetical protein
MHCSHAAAVTSTIDHKLTVLLPANNSCRINGCYVVAQEEGHVYDKMLRNQTIDYLQKRVKDGDPFFVFWAARSIHT